MAEETVFQADYPRGEHRDVCIGTDGKVLWETPWQLNVITNALRPLIAALIKGDSEPPLSFWAVGAGEETWDQGAAPNEDERRMREQLYNEITRKPITGNILFREGNRNQLEINTTFTLSDFPTSSITYPLREFGLFAGGTPAVNSGILINHRTHARIDMAAGVDLVRTLRLIF